MHATFEAYIYGAPIQFVETSKGGEGGGKEKRKGGNEKRKGGKERRKGGKFMELFIELGLPRDVHGAGGRFFS